MITINFLMLLALKSILLAVLGWIYFWLSNNQSKRLRYMILQLLFCILILLPFTPGLLPHWSVDMPTTGFAKKAEPTALVLTEPTVTPSPISKNLIERTEPSLKEKSGPALLSVEKRSIIYNWSLLIAIVWLSGAAFFLFRLLVEQWQLLQLRKKYKGQKLPDRLAKTLQELQVPGVALAYCEIIIHPAISIPFTFGWYRPIIVLPTQANTWSGQQLKIVLLHELAHIRQKDYLHNLIRHLCCCWFWWNIPLWRLAQKTRLESEKRADEWVINNHVPAFDYADQLVQITRLLRHQVFKTVLTIGHPQELRKRIEAILYQNDQRPGRPGVSQKASLISLVSLIFVCACMELESPPPPASYLVHKLQQNIHAPIQKLKPIIWQAGEQEASEAMPVLLELLPHSSPEIRSLSAWALGEIKKPAAFPGLKNLLNDEDELVLEMAIRSIGELELAESASIILPFLQSTKPNIQMAAVQALADIGTKAGISQLAHTLSSWPTNKQEEAITRIGLYGKRTAIPVLISYVKGNTPSTQLAASIALGRLEAKQAIPALLPLLKSENVNIQRETVRALGAIGDARVVDDLLPLLRDNDSEVRELVVWALDEIGT